MDAEEIELARAADAIIDSAETHLNGQRLTRAAGALGWLSCGAASVYEVLGNGSEVDPLSAAIIVVGLTVGITAAVAGYFNNMHHEERVDTIR